MLWQPRDSISVRFNEPWASQQKIYFEYDAIDGIVEVYERNTAEYVRTTLSWLE